MRPTFHLYNFYISYAGPEGLEIYLLWKQVGWQSHGASPYGRVQYYT